eukprot:465471-Lingulodinium_polyedra.AAC.1
MPRVPDPLRVPGPWAVGAPGNSPGHEQRRSLRKTCWARTLGQLVSRRSGARRPRPRGESSWQPRGALPDYARQRT